jgi:hypothetical protein
MLVYLVLAILSVLYNGVRIAQLGVARGRGARAADARGGARAGPVSG